VADSSRPVAPRKSLPVPATDSVERATVLRDVLEHVVEASKQPASPRQSRSRAALVVALCVVLLGLSAYSWIARPEAIWGPSATRASPVQDAASARLAMAMTAQRLNDFHTHTGRYPSTLDEIGEKAVGISYALNGDTLYVLSARTRSDSIAYRSNQSIDELLGRSIDLLARARR
jgi:hypothetical protein